MTLDKTLLKSPFVEWKDIPSLIRSLPSDKVIPFFRKKKASKGKLNVSISKNRFERYILEGINTDFNSTNKTRELRAFAEFVSEEDDFMQGFEQFCAEHHLNKNDEALSQYLNGVSSSQQNQ